MKAVSSCPPRFLCAIHLVMSLSFLFDVTIADLRVNVTLLVWNLTEWSMPEECSDQGKGDVSMWKTCSFFFFISIDRKIASQYTELLVKNKQKSLKL